MKFRGKKRYFRNLERRALSGLSDLNFNSWFDFYHIHIDNSGLGNRSWKARQQHLDALFRLASAFEEKIKKFSGPFQFWIEIDEKDSMDDAVYFHTPNPNEENFPAQLAIDVESKEEKNFLFEYMSNRGYTIGSMPLYNFDHGWATRYFLFKKDLGEGIIN